MHVLVLDGLVGHTTLTALYLICERNIIEIALAPHTSIQKKSFKALCVIGLQAKTYYPTE